MIEDMINEIVEHLHKNKDDWIYIQFIYELLLLREEEQ